MANYFVDLEATGGNLKKDRAIQIAVIVDNGGEFEIYNDLCYTDVEMSFSAMGVHHITPEMLSKDNIYWPDETDAFRALEKGNLPENYFISHGNELDIAMLEHEGFEPKMRLIDTSVCARHLLKDAEDYRLQTLRYQYGLYKKEQEVAKKLGISEIKAHDAIGDALLHYMLFELLLERVEGDIEKLVTLSKTPVLLTKVTFGKYRNEDTTFQELFETNPSYLIWVYTNMRMWEDLEYTVEFWLKKNPTLWKRAQDERRAKLLK